MEVVKSPGAVGPVPSKPAWQSKTLLMSAVTALLPLVYPPAGVWIAAHPELASAAFGLLFAGLRVVTNGKVSIR